MRKQLILFIISIILSFPIIPSYLSEEIENDVFTNALPLEIGINSGTVNTTDEDYGIIYRINFTSGDYYGFIYSMVGNESDFIEYTYYHENFDQIGEPSRIEEPGYDVHTDFVPKQDTILFIKFKGNGNYTIDYNHFETNDPNDVDINHNSNFLNDGDAINGKVLIIEDGRFDYYDTDAYSFNIESNQELRVIVRKTDSGNGIIKMKFSNEEIQLDESGEEYTFKYSHETMQTQTRTLVITGEGEYTIEVVNEPDFLDEEDLRNILRISVIITCGIIAFFILMVVAVIIIVIRLIRKSNGN